jgi:hypothetical protein
MTKRAWGNLADRILGLISDRGMTLADLVSEIGADGKSIGRVLQRLRSVTPEFDRRAHISRWEKKDLSNRTIWAAVYAAGDTPDARRPRALSRSAQNRRARIAMLERSERSCTVGSELQAVWR